MNAARKIRQAANAGRVSPVTSIIRLSAQSFSGFLTSRTDLPAGSLIASGDYCLLFFSYLQEGSNDVNFSGQVEDVEVILVRPTTDLGTEGFGIIAFRATATDPSVTFSGHTSGNYFQGYSLTVLRIRSSSPITFADSGSPQFSTATNSNDPAPPTAADPDAVLYICLGFMAGAAYGTDQVNQISGFEPETGFVLAMEGNAIYGTSGDTTNVFGTLITTDTSVSPGSFTINTTKTHTSWYAFTLPFKEV